MLVKVTAGPAIIWLDSRARGRDTALVTDAEVERALRDYGIDTSNAGKRLRAQIKAFYDSRKDWRIQKG